MEGKEPHKWEVLSSEYLYREPWFTVRREKVRLPNGSVIPSYYVLEYPDWVNVVAVTCDGRFVMLRQYRHAVGKTGWEITAGVCDPSDASPLEAARRELLEETGYGGGEWREYMKISANPATHTNTTHCFLAKGVERIAEPSPEATEDIEVSLLSFDRVRQLLEDDEIKQSLMAAPLWKYIALNR